MDKPLTIADFQDIESALMMAVRTSEEMISDRSSFNDVERAMILKQKQNWQKLLSKIQKYGRGS